MQKKKKILRKSHISRLMHITQKIMFSYIYSRKCTKYLHGTRSLLNVPMIDTKTGFVVQGHIDFRMIVCTLGCRHSQQSEKSTSHYGNGH